MAAGCGGHPVTSSRVHEVLGIRPSEQGRGAAFTPPQAGLPVPLGPAEGRWGRIQPAGGPVDSPV
eukprot:14990188-Alexandrium_andersonii.AAC.1